MAINAPAVAPNATSTPATGTVTAPNTAWTAGTWAAAVLALIGAPVTSNNISVMLHWMEAEEPPGNWYDRNNPLNTGLGTGGGSGLGSAATLAQGAIDTADTIKSPGYGAVLAAFKADAPIQITAVALSNSPWTGNHSPVPLGGAGHYAGGASIINNPGTPAGNAAPLGSAGEVPQGTTLIGAFQDSETGAVGLGTAATAEALAIAGAGATLGAAGSAGSSILGGLSGLAGIENALTSASFWKRVGVFAAGLGLMGVGLVIVLGQSKTAQLAAVG
jgi:hypothetical protein